MSSGSSKNPTWLKDVLETLNLFPSDPSWLWWVDARDARDLFVATKQQEIPIRSLVCVNESPVHPI